jgi:replicative DNA helicase
MLWPPEGPTVTEEIWQGENEQRDVGRVPPHNEVAERSVLGALLLDSGRMVDVSEFLRAEDFFTRRNGVIYETLWDMTERNLGIDMVTLGETLKASGDLGSVGGNGYLLELANSVTTSAHLLHHGSLVKETATLRRLIAEATEIVTNAYATEPQVDRVAELLDASEHRIFQISQGRDAGSTVELGVAIEATFKRIDSMSHRSGLTGIGSGFFDLDEMLCGFNKGELTIIAARPSMGKTAFALNLMDYAALHKPDWLGREPSVLFFSLEMGRQSIASRMLCSRARVDGHKLRTGRIPKEDYADLVEAAGELQGARMFIDDTPGLSVMALRSRARKIKHQHGLDMVVVDYLQLMSHPKAESRQQEISAISRALKGLARELEIPVIALSQLSRAVESREDKRPQLSDLRESGSIEQDADVVLMLYRAEYYNPTDENKGHAEVICGKQRNGPTGRVKLHFHASTMRFENREPSMAEPILS